MFWWHTSLPEDKSSGSEGGDETKCITDRIKGLWAALNSCERNKRYKTRLEEQRRDFYYYQSQDSKNYEFSHTEQNWSERQILDHSLRTRNYVRYLHVISLQYYEILRFDIILSLEMKKMEPSREVIYSRQESEQTEGNSKLELSHFKVYMLV